MSLKPQTPNSEQVFKSVKGLLNKLTLEKFEKLYQEFLKVPPMARGRSTQSSRG